MSLNALLEEVQSLRTALGGQGPLDPERFVRLDAQVRAQAAQFTRSELQALFNAMGALEELAQQEHLGAQRELSKLGGDRRAVRGYGCLRSSSQGQRISKKA